MIVKTISGDLEIVANQLFYDITHPFGAIRGFVTISAPIIKGASVTWSAISDDCYNEQVEFEISKENASQNLLFPDFDSANRYLSMEDIRIQFSSLEYSLLTSIDILCGEYSLEDKINRVQELGDSFDLHALILKLRLESYHMFGINELDEIMNSNKLCIDGLVRNSGCEPGEHYDSIFVSIGILKEQRAKIIKLKEAFLLNYDIQIIR